MIADSGTARHSPQRTRRTRDLQAYSALGYNFPLCRPCRGSPVVGAFPSVTALLARSPSRWVNLWPRLRRSTPASQLAAFHPTKPTSGFVGTPGLLGTPALDSRRGQELSSLPFTGSGNAFSGNFPRPRAALPHGTAAQSFDLKIKRGKGERAGSNSLHQHGGGKILGICFRRWQFHTQRRRRGKKLAQRVSAGKSVNVKWRTPEG